METLAELSLARGWEEAGVKGALPHRAHPPFLWSWLAGDGLGNAH